MNPSEIAPNRKVGGAELSRVISASHLSWEFNARRTQKLQAEVAVRSVGALRLAWVKTNQWGGKRGAREINANPEPYLTILMPLRGSINLTAATHRVAVEKHELGIWDSTQPMAFQIDSQRFEQISVLVPQRVLRAHPDVCAAQHCSRIDRNNVLSELCVRHMSTLAKFLDDELKPYELSISDLTQIMFDAVIASVRRSPTYKERLVAAIKEYIECYISEDTLSAKAISSAFEITPRYVHKLFEQEECTVRDWIIKRRLERSMDDIVLGD
ncbi:MAG: hypothetical protein AAF384_14065 [Pseudomonadota bacterium]